MKFENSNKIKSDLESYFQNNQKRLIHKWSHYFDIYERHFSSFRGKPCTILEIGIFHGGSLQMWKDYFGDQVQIYGVDINPNCKELEEENIEIHIGSQSDKAFLRDLKTKIPKVDILVDDGGHNMRQQIITYNELFDHVKDNGIYLCEDTHSSYILEHGGGLKRRGTFIEFSKNFIDQLHAYHSRQSNFQPSEFTKSVDSVHYYDSMVIIEKRLRQEPTDLKSGSESYKSDYHQESKSLKRTILSVVNKVLQKLRLPGIIWR